MPAIDQQDLTSRIRVLAEEIIGEGEIYIVDVQVRGQQGSRVVEVYADADQGISLDQLSELSRELEFLLDTEDVIKGRYLLNVSSPGADRPLTDPRQYGRHIGRDLRVTLEEDGAQRQVTGTLTDVGDESVTLEVKGMPEKLSFAAISEARVQLPW